MESDKESAVLLSAIPQLSNDKPPVLHVRSLSRPPSSLQAGEELLRIPRFNDVAAQRSMALLSPSPSLLTVYGSPDRRPVTEAATQGY